MKSIPLNPFSVLTFGACALSFNTTSVRASKPISQSPNIILIMADDMGYSDLGFMGSGIETPNIDRLAQKGIVFSQFYNSGRSCPTRASLLTGLYSHKTGMGWMSASNLGSRGYTGDLNRHCVTPLPRHLKVPIIRPI